jgi:preprotein translocase subunit SecY
MVDFKKFTAIVRVPELRKKLLILLWLILVFRIAAIIPVPGVPKESLAQLFSGNQLFGLLDIFSGGGLSRLSLVMLGLGPYITASIVIQLSTMIFPRLEEMQKEEGEAGRRKMAQWTRLLAVPFAALQGFGFLNILQRGGVGGAVALSFTPWELTMTLITIVAGTIFLMWIGELMTKQGFGNGISLIIFIGIIGQLPGAILQVIATWTPEQFLTYAAFLVVSVIVVAGVVVVTEGQRAIPVSYAKQVRGNRMFRRNFYPLAPTGKSSGCDADYFCSFCNALSWNCCELFCWRIKCYSRISISVHCAAISESIILRNRILCARCCVYVFLYFRYV